MVLGTSISSGHSEVEHRLFRTTSRSKSSTVVACRRTSSLAKQKDGETDSRINQQSKRNVQSSIRKTASSNKQSPGRVSATPHPIPPRKTSTFVKASTSIDSLRSLSTVKSDQGQPTRSSRQVQRCAVSRQVCLLKPTEEPTKTRAKSSSVSSRVDPHSSNNKPKTTVRNFCFGIKTSTFGRPTEKPIRTCQKNEQSPSPPSRKNTAKVSPISHPPPRVPLQKTLASKTVSKKINH